jgi:hypothetical protein
MNNPQPSKILQIGEGQQANYNTLALMARIVNNAKKNGFVRQYAASIVNHLKQKDYYGEIEIIHAFVRDKIRYVRDVRGLETLHTPEFIINNKYGDCDDKTMLTCSLLECLGHKTRMTICAIGTPYFCHVYPEVFYNGEWLSLEVTEPVGINWRPPNMTKTYSLEIDDKLGDNMNGVQFEDYLNPQEQSSALELMYLRHFFPGEYKKVVAFNREAKKTGEGQLSEIEHFAVYSDELNGAGLGRFRLKRALSKIAKVIKKANPVYLLSKVVLPKRIQKKLVSFERKHRKDIKRIGAAVAIIGGGFLFAPSIIGAGSSLAHGAGAMFGKGALIAKAAVIKAAGALKGGAPQGLQEQIQAEIGKLPQSAQEAAQMAGDAVANEIKNIGEQKLTDIVNKYTNNGAQPFTAPNDPRLVAATNEIMQQQSQNTGNIDNAAINAAVVGSVLTDAQKLRGGGNDSGINPVYLVGGALALILVLKR